MLSHPLPRKPVVVAICVSVAALHFVTGPHYRGPFRAFVTGYLIDLVLPFAMVLVLGIGAVHLKVAISPAVRGACVFLVGATVEFLQFMGVPLFGRTFDPLDFLMYATGVIVGLGFERWAFSTDPSVLQGPQP